MPFWKKSHGPVTKGGLTESALRGASHEQLAREAVAALVAETSCDRAGVWLEADEHTEDNAGEILHGVVWDRDAEAVPREWCTLAPRRIIPASRLVAGTVFEVEAPASNGVPLVGTTVGLSKVAWIPIEYAGKLRGMLMTGVASSRSLLAVAPMTALAAKLAMASALENERRLSTGRYLDLALCNRVLGNPETASGLESSLQEIVESCLPQAGKTETLQAMFSAVIQISGPAATTAEATAPRLLAFAGEERHRSILWSKAVQSLAHLALLERRPAGEMVYAGSTDRRGLRVIAVPVRQVAELCVCLVTGFQSEAATLSALERVELRARLAANIVTAMSGREAHTREQSELTALLEASSSAVVLLGDDGEVVAANRAARLLLQPLPGREEIAPGTTEKADDFSSSFTTADQDAVTGWLRGNAPLDVVRRIEVSGVQLVCGAKVRLQSHRSEGSRRTVTLVPTAEVSLERESQSAELFYLSEWLDQGVVIYDAEENIRLMNLRFAQLAGFAPEETAKLTSLELLIGRLQEQTAEPVSFAQRWRELALKQEGGEREEVHLMRPTARVLERASRPVLNREGQKIGRIELYKDLTAQRVFHAKLLQTEKLAALGQMVGGVAHELSNPLTSILGYAQRLLVRGDTSESADELRKIFAEAERAGAILRRMLQATRETGPERRLVNLNQLVQRTIDLQRFSLAAERIRVELSLDALLPNVMGDPGQLQQVLINLLGNARQAIEAQGNGGTIRIRTGQAGSGQVSLEMNDSGPGIPEGILSRIFDPFFTTKPAGVGTGLGLSIVLSLVREHGGQVRVASPRGGGAVFTIEIPAAELSTEPAAMRWSTVEKTEGRGTDAKLRAEGTSGARVLVIEDEPTVAQLIADVLGDEGFEVEVSLDGREAKDHILRGGHDLIICDMKMPNLDGQTLYEGMSREPEASRKRFLFVTGDVMGTKTKAFLTKSQVPHLAKPFRVEELLEKVYQVLEPARGAMVGRVSPIRKNSATTG